MTAAGAQDRRERMAWRSCRRPMSVVHSRITVMGRLPAYMIPGAAVASPSRIRSTSSSAVKPWASMIASVQPCGEPASSRSARFSSAPRQTFRGLTAIVPAQLPRGGPGRSRSLA